MTTTNLISAWTIMAVAMCSIAACSQPEPVILDKNMSTGHIYLSGTVIASGDHSVVYLAKDIWGLRQVNDNPYEFYSEICCDYAFDDYGGGGKILNVSNKNARIRVTCLDGEGLVDNELIIDVKPRTFSRIMFNSAGEAPPICRKLKCELIELY